jgi:hypothetical protein
MKVTAFKKKREVQIQLSAEEVAKITGHGSVESMMKKYPTRGMEDAIKASFHGVEINYQRQP